MIEELIRQVTPKFDRKVRLFNIACIRRVLDRYDMEVSLFIEVAELYFDKGVGSLRTLQEMAEIGTISQYRAPFHLARSSKLHSALGVTEGVMADAGFDCLPVFNEVFNLSGVEIEATPLVVGLANQVYTTGLGVELLAGAVKEPLALEHLRASTWHPRGCWVLDAILGKRD